MGGSDSRAGNPRERTQVTAHLVARGLTAIGASPVLSNAIEEVSDVVGAARSVVVSTAQIDSQKRELLKTAASLARVQNKPWVLDPVGAGLSQFRLDAVRELIDLKPQIIKGNAAEIAAICGVLDGKQHGVDGACGNDAVEVARVAGEVGLASPTCVVIISGKHDVITDGTEITRIANGHEMLGSVVGSGCLLAGIVGALLSVAGSTSLMHVALGASGVLSACAEKGMMGWPGGQKMPPGPARLECQVIDGFYAFSTTPSGRTILTERMEVLV